MSNYLNDFERDGVILLKDVLPSEAILAVKDEYDKLDKVLTNRDILKDEPLIVFWKHVVGEQKRICSFKSFPTLWSLIDKHITSLMRKTFKDKIKKTNISKLIQISNKFILYSDDNGLNIIHQRRESIMSNSESVEINKSKIFYNM